VISWLETRLIKTRHLKCSPVTDIRAIKIAHIGRCLSWLSINSNYDEGKPVTDSGIIKILENCLNLQEIEFSDCDYITDASMIRLAEGYPHLRTLNLRGCYDITDAGIIRLAERCTYLYT
jgi:hypothetical protein